MMRLILATILMVMIAAGLPAPVASAGVVINMPSPPRTARINVAAAAANAASTANYNNGDNEGDVGSLALARYGGAREGTYDNYWNFPYRNYSYPWPYGWGVYGWPFWGFGWGCFSSCSSCSPGGRACR